MEAIVVLVILAVIAAVVYGFYAVAQRRKELGAWSRRNGLSFSPSRDRGMDDRFEQFKCLRRGHSRYAYNIMAGALCDLDAIAFDYHYATGSGKNRTDHHFSAVVVESTIPLKGLYIRREGFFDKLTEFFGFDDIDFESSEFSRTFYVKSSDRKWAHAVIHQRMMEYLLSGPEFAVQFDRGHIIAWRSRRFKPADFDAAVRFVRGILDRLPDYLVQQQTHAIRSAGPRQETYDAP